MFKKKRKKKKSLFFFLPMVTDKGWSVGPAPAQALLFNEVSNDIVQNATMIKVCQLHLQKQMCQINIIKQHSRKNI